MLEPSWCGHIDVHRTERTQIRCGPRSSEDRDYALPESRASAFYMLSDCRRLVTAAAYIRTLLCQPLRQVHMQAYTGTTHATCFIEVDRLPRTGEWDWLETVSLDDWSRALYCSWLMTDETNATSSNTPASARPSPFNTVRPSYTDRLITCTRSSSYDKNARQ